MSCNAPRDSCVAAFWVHFKCSNFPGAYVDLGLKVTLLFLLQENNTLQRLKDEKAVLEGSVNYLRARLAVESAFTSDSSEGSTGSEGSSEGPGLTEQ